LSQWVGTTILGFPRLFVTESRATFLSSTRMVGACEPRGGERLARRAAIYARVSSSDQSTDLQLEALRAYGAARGWAVTEFADHSVSGAQEKRPALDALVAAAKARRIDVVIATKLDRLARSTHHLVTLAKELETLGVDVVIVEQAIDSTTPTGRLMFNVLAAIAEFERELIRERVVAGVRRAKTQGKRLGRPPRAVRHVKVERVQELLAGGLSARAVARELGVSRSTMTRARATA
jgi:DNA invertase Pin-like site-specific DNA recombinase